MSATRPGVAGATRTCPHCKATILESAAVCPACKGHLRFDGSSTQGSSTAHLVQRVESPLHVEGTLRHPAGESPWEYTMVLAIRNERGEEVARKVVGVGALQGGEMRTFTMSVEVSAVAERGRKSRH